jgi:hypothetical protein
MEVTELENLEIENWTLLPMPVLVMVRIWIHQAQVEEVVGNWMHILEDAVIRREVVVVATLQEEDQVAEGD